MFLPVVVELLYSPLLLLLPFTVTLPPVMLISPPVERTPLLLSLPVTVIVPFEVAVPPADTPVLLLYPVTSTVLLISAAPEENTPYNSSVFQYLFVTLIVPP